MIKEHKELLLKDLSARLLYKVKVTTTNAAVKFGVISGISIENKISVRTKHADIIFDCTEVKPYLFPISSMTEEQKEDMIRSSCGIGSDKNVFDWYNKNHFDYRGLIPMGLAIDATNKNIY